MRSYINIFLTTQQPPVVTSEMQTLLGTQREASWAIVEAKHYQGGGALGGRENKSLSAPILSLKSCFRTGTGTSLHPRCQTDWA